MNDIDLSKDVETIVADTDNIITPDIMEHIEPYRFPLMKIHEHMQDHCRDRCLPLLNGKDSLANFIYLMLGTLD